jgi:hypothetical protein
LEVKEIRADNIKYQPKDCLVLTSEGICQPCGLGSAAYVLLLGDRGKYAGVLEEAELRELKAAVEKALEVTPKKPEFWIETAIRSPATVFLGTPYSIDGSKHIASFEHFQSAQEYVAWKNAQESK